MEVWTYVSVANQLKIMVHARNRRRGQVRTVHEGNAVQCTDSGDEAAIDTADDAARLGFGRGDAGEGDIGGRGGGVLGEVLNPCLFRVTVHVVF